VSASGCSGGYSAGADSSESLNDVSFYVSTHCMIDVPLDSKTRDSGLLGEDIASDALNDWFGRWLVLHLFIVVLVVHIVAYSDKLAAIV